MHAFLLAMYIVHACIHLKWYIYGVNDIVQSIVSTSPLSAEYPIQASEFNVHVVSVMLDS